MRMARFEIGGSPAFVPAAVFVPHGAFCFEWDVLRRVVHHGITCLHVLRASGAPEHGAAAMLLLKARVSHHTNCPHNTLQLVHPSLAVRKILLCTVYTI